MEQINKYKCAAEDANSENTHAPRDTLLGLVSKLIREVLECVGTFGRVASIDKLHEYQYEVAFGRTIMFQVGHPESRYDKTGGPRGQLAVHPAARDLCIVHESFVTRTF